MRGFLLDVNALVALLWPAHDSHHAVQRWTERGRVELIAGQQGPGS